MPVFNWDDGDKPVVKPGFKYYWAFAITLTFGVFISWAMATFLPWSRWQHKSQARVRQTNPGVELSGF
jgi:hypothetical protein